MYSEEAATREQKLKALEVEREEVGLSLRDTSSRVGKYDRLRKRNDLKGVLDVKLKDHLKRSDSQLEHSARKAARMELLLQEEPGCLEAEGMEKTFRLKQADIASAVPIANKLQYFDLDLDVFGPYTINYSRHGRNLLLGGRKGHLATFDWRTKKLGCEFHVRETLRDVQYLHNEMMFAVAQKHCLFIYDHTGMELHCLKQHKEVNRLTFLPHHFLLVTADDHGCLRYLDTSIGKPVAEHRTRLGALHCMAHNPHNAIVHLGHQNGTVTLWSPNINTPLVKMLCHRGPLTAVAIDNSGRYMVTAAMDARLKIWDIRTYKELHSNFTQVPCSCVDVSQRGLVCVGKRTVVEVWRDVFSERQTRPYLTHRLKGEVSDVQFCPFEDCLGIGHSRGFTSIIVPGAGEANFDALEANPFQTKRQRQESEVKQLLEKVPSELISLDADRIMKLDAPNSAASSQGGDDGTDKEGVVSNDKRRSRGRGTLAKQLHRKQLLKEENKKTLRRQQVRVHERDKKHSKHVKLELPHILDRFR